MRFLLAVSMLGSSCAWAQDPEPATPPPAEKPAPLTGDPVWDHPVWWLRFKPTLSFGVGHAHAILGPQLELKARTWSVFGAGLAGGGGGSVALGFRLFPLVEGPYVGFQANLAAVEATTLTTASAVLGWRFQAENWFADVALGPAVFLLDRAGAPATYGVGALGPFLQYVPDVTLAIGYQR